MSERKEEEEKDLKKDKDNNSENRNDFQKKNVETQMGSLRKNQIVF